MDEQHQDRFRPPLDELDALVAEECEAAMKPRRKPSPAATPPEEAAAAVSESVDAALLNATAGQQVQEPSSDCTPLPEEHAARFIADAVAFLSGRSDASEIIDALRRALAEHAAQPDAWP